MQVIGDALRALRDVDGVHGSFVIALSGALIARDLPSAFDHQLFLEVGPRVARLHETFLTGGQELDACVLRYTEHKLYLRKMSASLIGVLSAVGVNMPALRMVSNLVIRRIEPLVAELAAAPPPAGPVTLPVVPAAPPPPPAVAAPAPATSIPASDVWTVESVSSGETLRQEVLPQDGRDPAPSPSDRHVRMYRGRRVED